MTEPAPRPINNSDGEEFEDLGSEDSSDDDGSEDYNSEDRAFIAERSDDDASSSDYDESDYEMAYSGSDDSEIEIDVAKVKEESNTLVINTSDKFIDGFRAATVLAKKNAVSVFMMEDQPRSGPALTEISKVLFENQRPEVMYLNNLSLLHGNVVDLAKHLSSSGGGSRLTTLHIKKNQFDVEGATTIVGALAPFNVLERLDFSQCWLGKGSFSPMLSSLAGIDTFTTLVLSKVSLSEVNAVRVARFAAKSRHLTHLDVSANELMDSGTSAIVSAVTNSPSIKTLILYGNNLREHTGLLNVLLTKNKVLQELDLSSMELHGKEVAGAMKALEKTNTTLTRLCLNRSTDVDTVLEPLKRVLRSNGTLSVVELHHTGLFEQYKLSLMRYIMASTSLTSLGFKVTAAVEKHFARNRELLARKKQTLFALSLQKFWAAVLLPRSPKYIRID